MIRKRNTWNKEIFDWSLEKSQPEELLQPSQSQQTQATLLANQDAIMINAAAINGRENAIY